MLASKHKNNSSSTQHIERVLLNIPIGVCIAIERESSWSNAVCVNGGVSELRSTVFFVIVLWLFKAIHG